MSNTDKRGDFNPRPREEGDYNQTFRGTLQIHFNPRPREEGDAFVGQLTSIYKISIHALVKRATCQSLHTLNLRLNFNPRPREEGDLVQARAILTMPYFNPRPREEGDHFSISFLS